MKHTHTGPALTAGAVLVFLILLSAHSDNIGHAAADVASRPASWRAERRTGFAAAGLKPAGSVELALEPAWSTVAVGEVVSLTVVAHAGDQAFVAADVDIRYPPGLLEVVQPDGTPTAAIEPVEPLQDFVNQVDRLNGRILYAAGLFAGTASGDVTLARIRFRALQSAPRVLVALADGTVSDADGKFVTGTLVSARVRIGAAGEELYLPLLWRGR